LRFLILHICIHLCKYRVLSLKTRIYCMWGSFTLVTKVAVSDY